MKTFVFNLITKTSYKYQYRILHSSSS